MFWDLNKALITDVVSNNPKSIITTIIVKNK